MNGNEGGREGYVKMEECKEAMVYMWGYLPGASPEKSPILSPAPVRLPDRISGGDLWKDVCGGGCGFAMAISGRFSILVSFSRFLQFSLRILYRMIFLIIFSFVC